MVKMDRFYRIITNTRLQKKFTKKFYIGVKWFLIIFWGFSFMNSLDKIIAEIKAAADELKADNDKAEQKKMDDIQFYQQYQQQEQEQLEQQKQKEESHVNS